VQLKSRQVCKKSAQWYRGIRRGRSATVVYESGVCKGAINQCKRVIQNQPSLYQAELFEDRPARNCPFCHPQPSVSPVRRIAVWFDPVHATTSAFQVEGQCRVRRCGEVSSAWRVAPPFLAASVSTTGARGMGMSRRQHAAMAEHARQMPSPAGCQSRHTPVVKH